MQQKRIRVAVVDDHPIFREGVVHALKAAKIFDVVGEAGTLDEALVLAQTARPDVLLLDVSMPGGGVQTANALTAAHPNIKIIMLTVSEQEETVTASLVAGAQGYLLKGTSAPELIRVVEAVHSGESYVSPGLAARLLTQLQAAGAPVPETKNAKASLSAREEAILEQVTLGLTNKEIARNLGVSEKTVKHYMTSIMNKLGVRNRVEAVLFMRRKDK